MTARSPIRAQTDRNVTRIPQSDISDAEFRGRTWRGFLRFLFLPFSAGENDGEESTTSAGRENDLALSREKEGEAEENREEGEEREGGRDT